MNFKQSRNGVLALAALASTVSAFAFAACSSDDTSTPAPKDAAVDTTTPVPDGGGSDADAGPAPRTVYAVDDANQLLKFTSTAPASVSKSTISGAPGVLGIDFRPATGDLYALGNNGTIYTLDKNTGVATAVVGDAGTPTFPVTLDPAATSFGFDFNPAADRIRVHANTGQNLRLHPANGQAVNATGDGTLTYEDGGTVKIVGSAYTNSVNPKPTATALYGIESDSNQLLAFANLDGGVVGGFARARSVGGLGVDVDTVGGFDIYGGQGGGDGGPTVNLPIEAYAALRVGTATNLYRVDLQSGTATAIGAIGHDRPLRGIAVQP
ncbi:DUF4394 domain-containing protein [Pendulispora rubella]|uniref:DUF4394 domain-containing protein n=1 Tax=Pendulispora rubella TaxID=2741070 RepID=A0ABZ2L4Z2_9BACT